MKNRRFSVEAEFLPMFRRIRVLNSSISPLKNAEKVGVQKVYKKTSFPGRSVGFLMIRSPLKSTSEWLPDMDSNHD